MGGDKHGSKSGRYVGGFLQLFDWNAKSRKKLFSSKSDLPEQPKQGKRSEGNYPVTRFHMADEDDYGARLSIKGGSDYSCASSVTDEDGYGTKVPGVVARLMGLDSLPTSNVLEPYSTPFYDTLSLRDVPYRGRNLEFYHDPQIMHSRHLVDQMESPPRNVSDCRSQKLPMPSRPIEKFQTETLPPKSAKTIPITHHKLLSPIKSPIFVPSQDAAHIMEAAAKIIEPGPQATPKTRLSSSGSSSVPFKVRELKEKLEATQRPSKGAELSQRPVESNGTKYFRGQPLNRSWNGSVDSTSLKASSSKDDGSISAKSKGKSISLAIQAKVNVQKREGLTTSNKSLGGSEEQDETKSVQSFKSQSNGPRITNKRTSTQSASSVLRQNNQKQNCSNYRDKTISKTSVSTSSGKKVITEVTSQVRQKNLNRDPGTSRTVSRKSSLQERDSDKEATYWGARNGPRKKRSLDGNMHFKNQVNDNMPLSKHDKPNHGSVVDRQLTWIEESRKKDMDVVSFTFTAPIITRSLPGSDQPRQLAEKTTNFCTDDRSKKVLSSDITKLSSSGLNLIGGDALSVLLEQKLKELTSSLETSHDRYTKTNTVVGTNQQNVHRAESTVRKAQEKKDQQELLPRDTNTQIYSELSSSELEQSRKKYIFQEVEVVDEYNSSKPQTKQWNDCHIPSPVSTLEPFTLTDSCYSSDSVASSGEESKQCSSSVQGQDVLGSSKLKTTETQAELSDSASSTSSREFKDMMKSTAWELGYAKGLLSNVELMFEDYATGRTRDILNPHLFDQMERWHGGGLLRTGEDESRLERKVLFDCVSECLDLKCQRFVGSGFKLWAKGIATVKRKDRLAEEVHKEIQGWRSLGNSNVDELVDKDMSSKNGGWMDFEVDEYMLGVEIQGEILDSLVMEIVAEYVSF